MAGFRTLRLDEVEARPDYAPGVEWLPLRHVLGVGAFGVNAWRGETGGEVIERHDESDYRHEELYVVLAGRARFTVAGEEIDAPAGTVVFLEDPTLERVAVAEEPGTLVLAVGAKRGEAYEVSAWEGRRLGTS
jgi:quercetin dioxygenase-like cupin family protein